ncbi:MAG TPA: PKD domain-containing protein [Myxococcaceae bacterium]|nr:PKD domain-containing protein [Myxococcaceae bacterium]
MTKTTLTVHCVAVLAGVLLACEGAKSEAPPQVSTSTQKKKLDAKTLESLGGECQSAQQPRLVTAPSEGTPEAAVQLKGQELNCGETYELVISGPDGTSTSESLVADAQGKVQSTLALEGAPGAHDVKLYDSSGEEVAQLSHGSNFRYGHLTWSTVGPRTAEFSLVNVFSRVFPGSGPDGLAVTGDIIQDTTNYTRLCFGDGYCTDTLRYEVTGYDAEQGWLSARALNSDAPQPLPGTGNTVVETEPNDSFGTANPVQVGDDYSSNIEVSSGVDYARFTLTEPAHIELRTVLVTMWDSYLYLYDGDGQYLDSDDDSGEGYASFISIPLGAGTYYVGARGYGSSTGQQLVQIRQLGVPPTGPITHTYSDDGPFTAEVFSCCRLEEQANAAGGSYRLGTQVGFSLANSSPVSSLPPLVEAPTRTPDFSFQIPATDAEGDELTFRLAYYHESYLWSAPPDLSVSSTGLVSWNTAGTFPGQLWAAQVIIEEHREGVLIGSVPVDFLLRITGDIGAPPTCAPQQPHYTVTVGDTVQFTVGTQDPDAGDTVTLHGWDMPWGATMTPELPLQGPSGISSAFSWKPSKWSAGSVYEANFMVMDASEQMSECSVSIEVQAPANWPPEANAGDDQWVNEGTTVTLNGTGSFDEEGDPFTYQWSVVSSQGPEVTLSSATSATPSFAAGATGFYNFMLTVTDGQGVSSSDTVTVYVQNVAPEVSATGGVVDEGSTFTSSGSFTDPGTNTWTARVNYGDSYTWQPLALNGKSFTLEHRYATNGYYPVQIIVRDSAGAEDSVTVYVTVRSLEPGVIVAGGTANEGSPFAFSGTITAPSPGNYWRVRIDYGDGASSSWTHQASRSFTLSHTYVENGTYTATIRVQNSTGVSTTTTVQVVVLNVAPTVTARVGAPVDEGSWLSFGGSYTDPSYRDTVVIRVDYGDGSPVRTVPLGYWPPQSFSMGHSYADSGTYLVTITATDDDGGVGTTTLTAVVNNVAPSVYVEDSWYGSNEGSAMVRRVSFYDPGTADTWTATVDYGDGTGVQTLELTSSSFNLSHVYANNGSYTVTLTVRDDDGGVGTATRSVYVFNVAPTVSATGGVVDEGSTFTSSGSFTDPGADTWTARVNYGDNTGWQPLALNGKSFTLAHRYANSGSYGVSIIVRDSDGAEGSTYAYVTVRNVVPGVTVAGGAANEGSPFVFSGSITDPGNENYWWVSIDYGDGSSSSLTYQNSRSFTLSRTYADNGTYTATIRVYDDEGVGITTAQVVVHNVAPTVSATVGAPVNEGSLLSFSGSFTEPSSRDTVVIRVDYGDGSPVRTITPSYWSPRSFSMSHRYADSGTYPVTITATDDDGGVGTTTLTAVVNNVAPSVYVEDSWYGSNEGSAMVRRASFYDPGTADTWTATVDYGDGTGVQTLELTSSSFNLSHVYANNGSYTVTLTVRDDDGGVGTATRSVYVFNVAPQVSALTGGVVDEGSTFTSSGSFTDPGADTWTAQVHYGDGTGWQPLALNGKSFTLEHRYANSGFYGVSIIVRDSDGAEGSTYMYVTVRNVAPGVTVAGGTTNEGSPFVFSGTITDPGNESYWWVTIDYGDGSYPQMVYTASRSFTLSRAYPDNGTYTATIRVQDDEGVGTATAQVVVRNVAPTVTATVGGPANEGSWISFNGSYTDPSTRDTAVIRVDYGDGSPVETVTPAYWPPRSFSMGHRYADNGLYLATISVTDDDGGVGTTTVPVVVLNVAPTMTAIQSCSPNEGAVCNTGGQFSDPGTDSWTVTVNFGDGSAPREISLGAGAPRSYATSHVYDDNGLYTVAITLTDDDGGSSTFRHLVRVQNVAPTVTAANDSPAYWGLPVNLTGTATDPSQADTQAGFTSLWTLGDGTTGSGLSTAHAYANPGSYWALLTVTDKDGGSNRVPAATAVTIQKRPGAVTCQDTTAVFGFPVALSAQFVDGLPGGLPGGRSLSFQLGGATDLGSATTGATGGASVQSPGELMPGTYPLTVTFAADSHYTAAEASCTLTVIQSSGTITGGGLRMANRSRGGFNVRFAEGGSVQGELQFQSDTTSFHAHVVSALGLAANNRQGWFAGVGRDGRAFTAYLEDNGEPGSGDVFKLWIDGVLHTGDGAISGGNIQIH